MRVTYAIGDIHGRHDLLLLALEAIEADAGERGADIVCLGDYVDRGPQSRDVVETLMRGARRGSDTLTCLKGNHEDMTLQAVRDQSLLGWWLGNGGAATLRSYGGKIPADHIAWMESRPEVLAKDGRVFVHAGLMPGVPLEQQEPEWVMWIRDRFLLAEKDFAGWPHIVHGHTPVHAWKGPEDPELLGWRTNLDTAAFHTGVLTVGVFEAEGAPTRTLRITA